MANPNNLPDRFLGVTHAAQRETLSAGPGNKKKRNKIPVGDGPSRSHKAGTVDAGRGRWLLGESQVPLRCSGVVGSWLFPLRNFTPDDADAAARTDELLGEGKESSGKGGASKPASTVHCTGESWILRASFYCTAVRASHDAPEQRLNSQDGPPAENRGVGDRGGDGPGHERPLLRCGAEQVLPGGLTLLRGRGGQLHRRVRRPSPSARGGHAAEETSARGRLDEKEAKEASRASVRPSVVSSDAPSAPPSEARTHARGHRSSTRAPPQGLPGVSLRRPIAAHRLAHRPVAHGARPPPQASHPRISLGVAGWLGGPLPPSSARRRGPCAVADMTCDLLWPVVRRAGTTSVSRPRYPEMSCIAPPSFLSVKDNKATSRIAHHGARGPDSRPPMRRGPGAELFRSYLRHIYLSWVHRLVLQAPAVRTDAGCRLGRDPGTYVPRDSRRQQGGRVSSCSRAPVTEIHDPTCRFHPPPPPPSLPPPPPPPPLWRRKLPFGTPVYVPASRKGAGPKLASCFSRRRRRQTRPERTCGQYRRPATAASSTTYLRAERWAVAQTAAA
ncbi:hypothetical protein Purlil1_4273 [Purpureocillium lilacinum]|uniref:Uncharacterized protein n=1 Tax=Purpureocillium lilacinum TaxID=33203 RepID=A0ABR0C4I1_PURLI|nr:hypothetical protein Purlil1_4273 [Purpureocillium lilacinum]